MRLVPAVLALIMASSVAPALAAPSYDLVFTRFDGLSGPGQALERWVERAAWHGVEIAPDPIVVKWAAGERQGLAQTDVEARLERQLETLLRDLPPRPRMTPVLQDAKYGYYLSPDVTWRESSAPAVSADAIVAAKKAALDGRLDAHLGALLPQHPQYLKLVAAAERYATLCKTGWSTLDVPKPYGPKKGPAIEVVSAFQQRLAAEGFYDGAIDGQLDDETNAALARYRELRQLKDKGLSDPKLVASLNVSCDARLATLGLNARRWRVSAWTPETAGAAWVEVNLAGQELRYYRDGAMFMMQRTVVGSDAFFFHKSLNRKLFNNSSPVLSDHISRVVVNPEWAVPARIAINEINKEIEKDPTYLEKHNFRTVTNKKGDSTYIQSSGSGNALGQIKILFPNSESVYLHDTPKRAVFGYPQRAMSHGCVRVQNAVDFGMALLQADAARDGRPFDEEALRARIGRSGPLNNDLAHEVPVFWEYYTASVDEAGNVRFHHDIYAYDEETARLEGAAQRAARVP